MKEKSILRKFKNFKRFTNYEIYFCDTVIINYNYLENGEKLGTKKQKVKLKKPMYLRHPRDWGNPSGNYCYILDQINDKFVERDCEILLKNCRINPKTVSGTNFAAYLGKNITFVEADYSGMMIKLETTFDNYCKLKEFEDKNGS